MHTCIWCGCQSPTLVSGFYPSTTGSMDQIRLSGLGKVLLHPSFFFNKSLLAYFKILKFEKEYSLIKSTCPIFIFFFGPILLSWENTIFLKFVLLAACWLHVYLRKKMWIPMFSCFIKHKILYLLFGACDLLYFFWHVENTLLYKKNSVTRSCALKFAQQTLSWQGFITAPGCRHTHAERLYT